MKVNFLTKGFNNWYGQTFLYPLIRYRKQLRDLDITLQFHRKETSELTDCDLLIIDNSWFRNDWLDGTQQVIEKLVAYRSRVASLHYMDFMDSSGMPHARALPYVDRYWKSYLLKDRSHYLKPLYSHRVYTDYYHHSLGVQDKEASLSEPIEDEILLKKLGLSWSSALANYSYVGLYQAELFKRLPIPKILDILPKFVDPKKHRNNSLFCRLGYKYSRETLAYQRRQICERISNRIPVDRVSRKVYFKELADSRVAISPFGNGEVCYRDYEAFLSGALLIKPDMSHMNSWPHLYRDNETVLYHRWDLGDFETVVEKAIDQYQANIHIAERAQETYRKYLVGTTAAEAFCQHFYNMLTGKEG